MFLKKFLFLYLLITVSTDLISQNSDSLASLINTKLELLKQRHDMTNNALTFLSDDKILEEYELLSTYVLQTDSLIAISSILDQQLNQLIQDQIAYQDTIKRKLEEHIAYYHKLLNAKFKNYLLVPIWKQILSSETIKKGWVKFHLFRKFENNLAFQGNRLNLLLQNSNNLIEKIRVNQNKSKKNKVYWNELNVDIKKRKLLLESKIKQIDNQKVKFAKRLTLQENKKHKKPLLYIDAGMDEDRNPTNSSRGVLFESKKQNLVWPVSKGYIFKKYGTHPHELVKEITITNYGVEIMTNAGESVKSVYNGTVSQIHKLDDQGYILIINHGKYLSAYHSLAQIFIKEGQEVAEGQVIGKISQSLSRSPILNFEIWNGLESEDPELWLKRK